MNPSLVFVVNINETQPEFLKRAAEKFDGTGLNVGILDGHPWADSLTDFGVGAREEYPRVWISYDKLERWYEDRDLLSVEALYQMVDGLDAKKDKKDVKARLFEKLGEKFPVLVAQSRAWHNTVYLHLRSGLRILAAQEEYDSLHAMELEKKSKKLL